VGRPCPSTLSNIANNSQQYLFNRGRASNRALLKMAGKQENAGINHKRFPHNLPHVDISNQQFCIVGSALILVSWIQFRIGVGKNDPQGHKKERQYRNVYF
jgi:hypothetical protein